MHNPSLHALYVTWAMQHLEVINSAIEALDHFSNLNMLDMLNAMHTERRKLIEHNTAYRDAAANLMAGIPAPTSPGTRTDSPHGEDRSMYDPHEEHQVAEMAEREFSQLFFPALNYADKLLVSPKDITSAVAYWAIQQSPYSWPHMLKLVTQRLHDRIQQDMEENSVEDFMEFAGVNELQAFIHEMLSHDRHYQKWNNRKNGNRAPLKFSSRHSTDDDPDDDFIDLEALERNAATMITQLAVLGRGYLMSPPPLPDRFKDDEELMQEHLKAHLNTTPLPQLAVTEAAMLELPGSTEPTHYLLREHNRVSVKNKRTFQEEGGSDNDWGKAWTPIRAVSFSDARNWGENNSHALHTGEDLPPKEPVTKQWPKPDEPFAVPTKLMTALYDWLVEVGSPNMGKYESEELYRQARAFFAEHPIDKSEWNKALDQRIAMRPETAILLAEFHRWMQEQPGTRSLDLIGAAADFLGNPRPTTSGQKVWECKIGYASNGELSSDADRPMRHAIEKAFEQITGRQAEFCFSGWGGKLDEHESNVVKVQRSKRGRRPEGKR